MKTQIYFKKTPAGQYVISDTPNDLDRGQSRTDIAFNCDYNSYDNFADICCFLYNSQFSTEPELIEALTYAARMYNVEVSR